MTFHRITPFKPYSRNPIGDAMRHGDASDVARERAKTYTETDTGGGGDKWREMLLAQSQQENDE